MSLLVQKFKTHSIGIGKLDVSSFNPDAMLNSFREIDPNIKILMIETQQGDKTIVWTQSQELDAEVSSLLAGKVELKFVMRQQKWYSASVQVILEYLKE